MSHIVAMTAAKSPYPRASPKPRGMLARAVMFWTGLLLVIVSPLVGALPGPGGIFVFAAGFGLMLRGSKWVKKLYARFKKKHPKKGDWADFGLQRASYKRRQARTKADGGEGVVVTPPKSWTEPGELARRRRSCSRKQRRDGLLGVRPPDRPGR